MMSVADGRAAAPARAKTDKLGGEEAELLAPTTHAPLPNADNAPSGEAELTAADGGRQSPTSASPSTSAGGAPRPGQQAARASLDGTVTATAMPGAFGAGVSLAADTSALPPASDAAGADAQQHRLALPRGSRVLVKGNARTKKELIGLECIVRKAVGLGGWHWLVSEIILARARLEEGRILPSSPPRKKSSLALFAFFEKFRGPTPAGFT